MTTTLTIGFTRTDRAADYIPSMDGYRPGARQDVLSIRVEDEFGTPETWAEAVFIATNAPRAVVEENVMAAEVHAAILAALENSQARRFFRSLSVGDTVSVLVDGKTVTLACQSFGWERVA